MPTYRPVRTRPLPPAVVRAVVVGSVLSSLLPTSAVGTVVERRDPPGLTLAVPSAQAGLPLPTSPVRVPVNLRVRAGESAQKGDLDLGAVARRGCPDARPAGVSRQAQPARPTVTILAPTDLATVPTGILRVRGTVSPPGDAVRVLVNGVRAIVRSGEFTAAVRVTPHTLILSAVAATPGGLTDRHQVGLTVRGSRESAVRLHPFPNAAAFAIGTRFSLVPTTVSSTAQADEDGDGAIVFSVDGPGSPRIGFEGSIGRYAPPTARGAADPAAVAPMRLVSNPVDLRWHGAPTGSGTSEERPRVDVEGSRRVLAMRPRPAARVEFMPPSEPGVPARDLAAVGPQSFKTRVEGDVEQNPRGMPLGATYSFGLLFIFDGDGLRHVRLY